MPIIQFPFTSFYPVSAKGFEYDNLYIHFFMELPNSKSCTVCLHHFRTGTVFEIIFQ